MARCRPIMAYTDGSCRQTADRKPGGWGAVINYDERIFTFGGYELDTTNNRMELKAVLEVVKKLVRKGNIAIIIFTDSSYVFNAIEQMWIVEWWNNGWVNKKGKEIANNDLWQQLVLLIMELDKAKGMLQVKKVQGHSGNTFNELADKIAKGESEKALIKVEVEKELNRDLSNFLQGRRVE